MQRHGICVSCDGERGGGVGCGCFLLLIVFPFAYRHHCALIAASVRIIQQMGNQGRPDCLEVPLVISLGCAGLQLRGMGANTPSRAGRCQFRAPLGTPCRFAC